MEAALEERKAEAAALETAATLSNDIIVGPQFGFRGERFSFKTMQPGVCLVFKTKHVHLSHSFLNYTRAGLHSFKSQTVVLSVVACVA